MRFWTNLVGYQLVWFAAVIGAGRGHAWPGVVAALVFVGGQAAMSHARRSDLRLVACALLLGVLIDTLLAQGGWLTYAARWPHTNLAPAWILALWAAFAMTLNHSLLVVQRRIGLAAVLGACGGPLSYWGAARGWHAVAFAPPAWWTLVALAMAWALALALLAVLAQRWSRMRVVETDLQGASSR